MSEIQLNPRSCTSLINFMLYGLTRDFEEFGSALNTAKSKAKTVPWKKGWRRTCPDVLYVALWNGSLKPFRKIKFAVCKWATGREARSQFLCNTLSRYLYRARYLHMGPNYPRAHFKFAQDETHSFETIFKLAQN